MALYTAEVPLGLLLFPPAGVCDSWMRQPRSQPCLSSPPLNPFY